MFWFETGEAPARVAEMACRWSVNALGSMIDRGGCDREDRGYQSLHSSVISWRVIR